MQRGEIFMSLIKEAFTDKKFLTDLAIILPFSVFLFGLLGQATEVCGNGINFPFVWEKGNFFCFGQPDWLRHTPVYDMVFLRAGMDAFSSHWFSELFFPIVFFVCYFLTFDTKVSLIYSFFYLLYHEANWSFAELFS